MNKIKIMSVFGTRPDAIKMAPLVKILKKDNRFDSIVCVTGQHREMLDQVIDVFDIKPDYNLKIMKKSQTLQYITTSIMEKLGKVLDKECPDMILVHGDTATCLVSSLTSFYRKIPIGHVEAGLRTFDPYSPFPEEMNRKLVGSLATLHFCPTNSNYQNLLREGINKDNLIITGNTVIDALKTTITDNYTFSNDKLNQVDFTNKRVITLTAHRNENLGKPLEDICDAILEIANQFDDVLFVYAVHLNPAVMNVVYKKLDDHKNILLTKPLNVRDLHNLMNQSFMIMTDSGGLQEEAPSLGKPVLVLRKETERPEAIEAGTVKLSGVSKDNIVKDAIELLTNEEVYKQMSCAVNPYGDGQASKRIIDGIFSYFNKE